MESDTGVRWFEDDYRHGLESQFAFSDLDQEHGTLGYSSSDRIAFLKVLETFYPPGHWANAPENYPTTDDIALQTIIAGACSLKPGGSGVADHVLDSCLRVVRSPALSPYVLLLKRIVVVPRGFLNSVGTFLSTIFEMSIAGAKLAAPRMKVDHWRPDQLLAAQVYLMDQKPYAYRHGIFVALQPTMMTQVIADFPDSLRAAVFGQLLNRELQQMMPSSGQFDDLGVGKLGSILPLQSTVQHANLNLRRLVVCVAISHELGHLFVGNVAKSMEKGPWQTEADGAFQDEGLADAFGLLILNRLKEAGVLSLLLNGHPVTYADFISAVAAFNAWNLSLCLARLLAAQLEKSAERQSEAIVTLTQVATRWKTTTGILLKSAEEESGDEQEHSSVSAILSSWSAPCAEMLRILLNAKGVALNHEQAFSALDRLGDTRSKIHAFLAG